MNNFSQITNLMNIVGEYMFTKEFNKILKKNKIPVYMMSKLRFLGSSLNSLDKSFESWYDNISRQPPMFKNQLSLRKVRRVYYITNNFDGTYDKDNNEFIFAINRRVYSELSNRALHILDMVSSAIVEEAISCNKREEICVR